MEDYNAPLTPAERFCLSRWYWPLMVVMVSALVAVWWNALK